MPLIDEWPLATIQVQEVAMYGETLEQKFARRDAEREKALKHENITNLLKEDVDTSIIAKVWNIPVEEVLAIQKENKKTI